MHAAIHQPMIHRPLLDDAVQVGAVSSSGGVTAMVQRSGRSGQGKAGQVSFLAGQPHRWTDPPACPLPRPVGVCLHD